MTTDDAATIAARLARATALMGERGVDALLLGPGADLRYLTGYDTLPLERLTLLVARSDGRAALVVPRLERARTEAFPIPDVVEVVDWDETGDPFGLAAAAMRDLPSDARLGVGDRLWAVFVLGLQAVAPNAIWSTASDVLRELRMRKDPAEVEALRRAAQAIDRVHRQVPALLRAGRTEEEVGRDIGDLIVAEGHDEVGFVIVASGPNGASPHHELADRRLEEGDAVVVDIGGPLGGYWSDCTRNYVIGEVPQGYAEAHAALEAAQRAACEAVRPGVTAASVDAAARDVLAEAGYAERFVHRTGHGIGLEVHEEPYIVAGNDLVLEPGMSFSVEPGVYTPGRWGMRIEDIVVVTETGGERLNTLDREVVHAPHGDAT